MLLFGGSVDGKGTIGVKNKTIRKLLHLPSVGIVTCDLDHQKVAVPASVGTVT